MKDAILEIARIAAAAGLRQVSFRVDDAATAGIAAIAGARLRTSVYVKEGEEPYAIDSATVTIGGVELEAQSCRRPATADELAVEGGWSEHRDAFRARSA